MSQPRLAANVTKQPAVDLKAKDRVNGGKSVTRESDQAQYSQTAGGANLVPNTTAQSLSGTKRLQGLLGGSSKLPTCKAQSQETGKAAIVSKPLVRPRTTKKQAAGNTGDRVLQKSTLTRGLTAAVSNKAIGQRDAKQGIKTQTETTRATHSKTMEKQTGVRKESREQGPVDVSDEEPKSRAKTLVKSTSTPPVATS
ncbi:hypothetical protein AAF712_016662, partial [Marasmius tenuissimus]